MFRLDEHNDLVFNAADLKEVYEPIITQYGFEYEAFLDRDKKGLVWTKLYEGDEYEMELLPTMVIRETCADICPAPEEATYFSTSLWWEISSAQGLMIFANPKEWGEDFDELDEVELLAEYAREARKEVNEVLEQCRQQLKAKLIEIRAKLRAETKED